MSNVITLREATGATFRPLTASEYARLARELATPDTIENLRPLRLAVLSSCSLQFAEPALVVESARRRLQLRTYFGPFGQFEQPLSDPASALHAFEAEALLLFMRPEDVDSDFVARFYAGEKTGSALAATIDRLLSCVKAFRARSAKPV
ncbi:MAG TPA: hypothetical protein VGD49_08480, partial [Longimicrobiales bacterium]